MPKQLDQETKPDNKVPIEDMTVDSTQPTASKTLTTAPVLTIEAAKKSSYKIPFWIMTGIAGFLLIVLITMIIGFAVKRHTQFDMRHDRGTFRMQTSNTMQRSTSDTKNSSSQPST